MTTHLGSMAGFVHAHHAAAVIAAVAAVGAGTAGGVAWHSGQSPPTRGGPATAPASVSNTPSPAWHTHMVAYTAQVHWLSHHGIHGQGWLGRYRDYHHQLQWLLGHRDDHHGQSLHRHAAQEHRFLLLRDRRLNDQPGHRADRHGRVDHHEMQGESEDS